MVSSPHLIYPKQNKRFWWASKQMIVSQQRTVINNIILFLFLILTTLFMNFMFHGSLTSLCCTWMSVKKYKHYLAGPEQAVLLLYIHTSSEKRIKGPPPIKQWGRFHRHCCCYIYEILQSSIFLLSAIGLQNDNR